MQQNALFKALDHLFAFRLVGFFQAARDVVHALAVGNGNQDVLIHVALQFVNLLDDGVGNLCHAFRFALELLHGCIERTVGQCLLLLVAEFVFVERYLHGQCLQDVHLAVLVVGSLYGVDATVPYHIHDIHTDALTHQCVAALGVDYGTLLVHHVVVFQQTFTDTEVVFLHLLLCPFDGLGYHAVLNHLTLLEAQLVHDAGNAVGREESHQVIFQRDEEDG